LDYHQSLPVRDQRWGRTGERARESGAGRGVAASELGFIPVGSLLIEPVHSVSAFSKTETETETEPNNFSCF